MPNDFAQISNFNPKADSKAQWVTYVKELDQAKGLNKNGKIDSDTELAAVFNMNQLAANALWDTNNDVAFALNTMDINHNGTVTDEEYKNYVRTQLHLNPETGGTSDCGTGIPCNWRVYASSQEDRFAYAVKDGPIVTDLDNVGIYPKYVFSQGHFEEQFKVPFSFDARHKKLEKGSYDEIPDVKTANQAYNQEIVAAHSETGRPWDNTVTIDHALILALD